MIQYAVLVAVGLVSGFAAQRLSTAIRGSFARRLVLKSFVEGAAIFPGTTLAVRLMMRRTADGSLFDVFGVYGAFILPYVTARVLVYLFGLARSVRRETLLPFEHWFQLLRTDPDAAHEFLSAYLIQQGRRADLLAELRAAHAAFARSRRSDPVLPLALDRLRSEIDRWSVSAGP